LAKQNSKISSDSKRFLVFWSILDTILRLVL
jgi:hypothetical protein